jgi:hypothetical protein
MNRLLALLLGGLLAGCSTGPAVPAAGREFDGTYTGENTLIRGGGYPCGDPAYAERLVVADGRFDYPFAVNPPRTAPLPVQIGADGTLAGQMQYLTEDYLSLRGSYNPLTTWVTLRGHISEGVLEATVTDYRCTRRLTARKG